jgi:hypothetical protein
MTTTNLFDQITVNMATGSVSYPKLDGFELDMERVYRTAALFAPHCASTEMAVRQAIHQQLAAHQGMTATLAGLR